MNRKRPALVWIISVFTFLTAGISILTVLAAALLPINEFEADVAPLTLFDYVAAVVFALAAIVAAIYLMRLKKAAFYWYVVPFVAWVLLSLWDAVTKGFAASMYDQDAIGYMVFALVVSLAICVYCWRLVRKEVLR
jgi:hypothetical protein